MGHIFLYSSDFCLAVRYPDFGVLDNQVYTGSDYVGPLYVLRNGGVSNGYISKGK